MNSFLEAVAQSLRNLGLDANVIDTRIELAGIRFEVQQRYNRKSFKFCGRIYRTGNVLQAAVDLVTQLPELLRQRDAMIEVNRADARRQQLNKELYGTGLSIEKQYNLYQLRYTAGFDQLEAIAKQIVAAEAISFAPIDTMLNKLSATFTSEGGFSLN